MKELKQVFKHALHVEEVLLFEMATISCLEDNLKGKMKVAIFTNDRPKFTPHIHVCDGSFEKSKTYHVEIDITKLPNEINITYTKFGELSSKNEKQLRKWLFEVHNADFDKKMLGRKNWEAIVMDWNKENANNKLSKHIQKCSPEIVEFLNTLPIEIR